MAKLAFSKLGLKKKDEIQVYIYNNNEIIIKQYLPMDEKVKLVSSILNDTYDDNNFVNPMKLEVIKNLAIIMYYTNITFTDKQKEDISKLYDLFKENGVFEDIFSYIPAEELDFIEKLIKETIDSFYTYKHSALGILDIIQQDYSNVDMNAEEIGRKLGDPENLKELRDILTKLG